MTFFMQSYLAPIPSVVIKNYNSFVAPYLNQDKRVLLAPHCELVFNLLYRGYFQGINMLGALDRNRNKIGKSGNGVIAYSYDTLEELKPDIVMVANTRYHNEIYNDLKAVKLLFGFELIDLCENYNHIEFRKELAEALDCRAIARLRPGCVNVPKMITSNSEMKVEVVVETGWGLGDKLCALSAAREFARRNPNLRVYFNTLSKIVSAYDDELVHLGLGAYPLPENFALFHREKDSSPAANYLGCYFLGLGLNFTDNPQLDLPAVPPLEGLVPGKYLALQPTANWAKPNLSLDAIKQLIKASPLPVVLTGEYIPVNTKEQVSEEERERINHELITAGADVSFIGDELNMLRLIRHAAMVVAPRSASAHIAAGYGVKSVVWVPTDGENWHLDYPCWPHRRVIVSEPHAIDKIISEMNSLFENNKLEP